MEQLCGQGIGETELKKILLARQSCRERDNGELEKVKGFKQLPSFFKYIL